VKSRTFAVAAAITLASFGCNHSTEPKTTQPPSLVANDTPAHAIERLITSYENKNESAFAGMVTGNYQYEFSNATDPNLVTDYATGWFKVDETSASTHLFSGYTPSGGATLEPASTITINLAVGTPTDDNSSGVDPTTHKLLATRVDGLIVVPNPGAEATTFVIENNFNVFYIVRGDSAVGLDASQPADAQHWYIYRWKDLTGGGNPRLLTQTTQATSWGGVKAKYR